MTDDMKRITHNKKKRREENYIFATICKGGDIQRNFYARFFLGFFFLEFSFFLIFILNFNFFIFFFFFYFLFLLQEVEQLLYADFFIF